MQYIVPMYSQIGLAGALTARVGIFSAARQDHLAIFSGLTVTGYRHTVGSLPSCNKEPAPCLRRGRVVVPLDRSGVSTGVFGEVGNERR